MKRSDWVRPSSPTGGFGLAVFVGMGDLAVIATNVGA